jgi:hypothetical protein
MIWLLFLLLHLVSSQHIMCSQLWRRDVCESTTHCKWAEMTVTTERGNHLMITTRHYGCQPKEWCAVRGVWRERKQQCRKLGRQTCTWDKPNCRANNATMPTLDIWHANNLCFSFAFNGRCDECVGNRTRGCFCWPYSDYSDCIAQYPGVYPDYDAIPPWSST